MKNLIFLSLLLLSTAAFGQSKKTINKQLSLQFVELDEINDSLQRVFLANNLSQINLRRAIFFLDESLTKQRREIAVLRKDIQMIKSEMVETGDNPDQFVGENELNMIYSLVTETIYQNEARKVVDTLETIVVVISDISEEKIKVQNVLLQAKINEYKEANSRNALIILQQKAIFEKLNRLKTSATDQLDVCTKMKQILEDKYNLLRDKQIEFDQKREEEEIKAIQEQQKKEAKKKKSNSKIKFVPPRSVNEMPEEDYAILMDASSRYDNSAISSKEVAEEPLIQQETIIAESYAEEMPEFPGGREALQKYIHDNLNYPPSAIEDGIQGKVYVKFVVAETGEISHIKVVRGIADCFACETEAVRMISQMPNWIPGKNSGRLVACYYTLPINFVLE